jgi:hypothetical protein
MRVVVMSSVIDVGDPLASRTSRRTAWCRISAGSRLSSMPSARAVGSHVTCSIEPPGAKKVSIPVTRIVIAVMGPPGTAPARVR